MFPYQYQEFYPNSQMIKGMILLTIKLSWRVDDTI
jgi:hypothetical protein